MARLKAHGDGGLGSVRLVAESANLDCVQGKREKSGSKKHACKAWMDQPDHGEYAWE